MERGNIQGWSVKVGDKVVAGDVIATIETDKAAVDFEMQDEGYVAQILYPAGSKDIAVGSPIAILVDSEADVAKFKDFKAQDAGSAGSAPVAKKEEAPVETKQAAAP
jgi:pyruvate dehydrogenase E2 component (dihydrolipoamide acetyltransferase)